ncbi:hypothetical protein [Vibrio mediterranei]|uniref:hypothetical protein n=1 Tax=Vibrio mediterranei TaxID=689 RepID=UPI00148D6DCE|nr:hypothetical protein [Vibrio mediterranei]NOH31670.1 hypothetical protein [Vibrio mediterranei]
MKVFEITKPGTKLLLPETDKSWEMEWLIRNLISHFYEVNLAYNLFLRAKLDGRELPCSENLVQDARKRSLIEELYKNQPSGKMCRKILAKEISIKIKQEKLSSGQFPQEFIKAQTIIYARSFQHSLEGFYKLLKKLNYISPNELDIKIFLDDFENYFPLLSCVVENRTPNDFLLSIGGFIPIGMIDQNRFLTTYHSECDESTNILDGEFRSELIINHQSLEFLQSILIGVINSFSWDGPEVHLPTL